MQIIDKTLTLPTDSLSALDTWCRTEGEHFLVFDIETTGLSPKVSSLYLIGALWFDPEDKQFHTRQWFADDYISEKEILSSFYSFLQNFTTLVHYNGSGFDIPYMEKKYLEHSLPSPFESIRSLDIYREIRSLKSLFQVPNLKLFTVEKLTGFLRKDILTGKDCIETYSQFMQKKYFKDETMEQEKEKLLLHNFEDIIGTYYSAQLLFYKCGYLISTGIQPLSVLEEDHFLSITLPAPCTFPFPAGQETESFTIGFEDDQMILRILLCRGIFYHFFQNYKDYFYLPAEDTAIHKSVGTYVDKQFREPAKASNCYIKKEGIFLAVPSSFSRENLPLFRKEYKARQNYVLWDEKTKQDSSLLEEILHSLLSE